MTFAKAEPSADAKLLRACVRSKGSLSTGGGENARTASGFCGEKLALLHFVRLNAQEIAGTRLARFCKAANKKGNTSHKSS